MNYSRGPRGATNRGDAQRVTASVKWFNRTKGFGFITASDGSGDVFLPAAVLAQSGHDDVGEGATIICEVTEGPKGRAVVSIVEIDTTTASQRAPRGSVARPPGRAAVPGARRQAGRLRG